MSQVVFAVSPQQILFPEIESLIESRHGNADAVYSEINGFIETLQRDMVLLENKVHREDSLTVASVAYRLKSSAKALGLESIHQSADQIETSARRNQLGQLSAEIDLMKHHVEIFIRSDDYQHRSGTPATVNLPSC